MKVADLRRELLKFIETNPGKIIIGAKNPANVIAPIIVPDERNNDINNRRRTGAAVIDANIDTEEVEAEVADEEEVEVEEDSKKKHECSIQECDYEGCISVQCNKCDLWFCKRMHMKHSSHLHLQLKPGKVPRAGFLNMEEYLKESSSAATDKEEISIRPTASASEPSEISDKETIKKNVTGTKRKASSDIIINSRIDSLLKKIGSIMNMRNTKTNNIGTIRSLLQAALNYSSYDVEFLKELAKELEIDLDGSNIKMRSRTLVMEFLIDKLILKIM
jgi:hypothetical protein